MSPVEVVQKLRTGVETPSDLLLLVRMGLWGSAVHVLKFVVPLPALVRLMRLSPASLNTPASDRDQECEKIVKFARWACRATQWTRRGRCLEQGLVSYRYLSRLNAEPFLLVGVRLDGEADASRGHAWVEAGGRVIGEHVSAIAPFTRVLAFDPNGHLVADAP